MKVAVVGAGAMGSATAYALGRRGHSVVLFEQFPIGHDRGSSHGRSRIVRRAYPDRFYTEIMVDAYPLWANLEAACGEQLLHEVGLLYFGDRDAAFSGPMVEGLADCEVPFTVFEGAELESVQPGFRFSSSEIGVFTPDAGWVAADRALAAMRELSGAEVRVGLADSVALRSEFDAVVVAAGGWIRRFVPSLDVRTTLQTFVYLDSPLEGPVWIEDGEFNLYGFPSEPGASTMKFGYHRADVEISMDSPREASPAHLEALREFAGRRLVDSRSPEEPLTPSPSPRGEGDRKTPPPASSPTGVRDEVLNRNSPYSDLTFSEVCTCVYTSTANEDFRWGELAPGVFWVSPCSGHGFKFAPWIGERMADFCEGRAISGALDSRFGSLPD